MACDACASTRSPSRTATEQAFRQVSSPRTITKRCLQRLFDPRHFRNVVLQHVLHAGLEGGGGGGAAGAGAAHVQPDDAGVGVEAVEEDVAPVLGHSRADAGVQEVLDLGDDLGGLALVDAAIMIVVVAAR